MLFNSVDFAIFLPLVFHQFTGFYADYPLIYQNSFVVLASYVFLWLVGLEVFFLDSI